MYLLVTGRLWIFPWQFHQATKALRGMMRLETSCLFIARQNHAAEATNLDRVCPCTNHYCFQLVGAPAKPPNPQKRFRDVLDPWMDCTA